MLQRLFKKKTSNPSPDKAASPVAPTQSADKSIDLAQALSMASQYHGAGQFSEAEAAYRQILDADAQHFDALHMSGVLSFQMGNHGQAVELISRAIAVYPLDPVAHCNLGELYRVLSRLGEAAACYQKAVALNPDYVDAHWHLGDVQRLTGRLDEAVASYRMAVSLNPGLADAHNSLGNLVLGTGHLDDAIVCYQNALSVNPDFAEAHSNLGNALKAQGKLDEALASYERALSLNPGFAAAHSNLGDALRMKGQFDEAILAHQRALSINPGFANAHCSLGNVLRELGKLDEALNCYRKAIAQNPEYAEAHNNEGLVLKEKGELREALACYQSAISANPGLADAHYNLGLLHLEQGDLAKALACFDHALEINPEFAETHNAAALVHLESRSWNEAIASCRKALTINPDLADAHNTLGVAFQRQGNVSDPIACYRKALDLNPRHADAYSNLAGALKDQGKVKEAIDAFRRALKLKPQSASTFSDLLLTMQYDATCSATELFEEHRRYSDSIEKPLQTHRQPPPNSREPERRLKIGYVSADFRTHSVAFFIEPILAHHDKEQVEVYCYSNSTRQDLITSRIAAFADHWIPCSRMSDDELARRIRNDGIDILVDLSGHTAGNRLPTFARRPSPVQMTWLGYAATTGLSSMDYRITSADLDPPGVTERFHTEILIRLPSSAAFTPSDESPPVNELPALKSTSFTFACLNNLAKINPGVVAVWGRILSQSPNAKLILGNVAYEGARQHLIGMFSDNGVSAAQLIFSPRIPLKDFLALHSQIDLALDPFPFNGGTTSLHALWMGVPVVTLCGENPFSRCGAAVLHFAGLPEFIAGTEQEYVEIALAYAANLPKLSQIRRELRDRMTSRPENNPRHITRSLESGYRESWRKWCECPGGA
jgi:protein O-GlcNAc transferase